MITGRAFIRRFGTAPNGKPLAAILMIVAGDEISQIPEGPDSTGTISTVVGGNLACMQQLSILPDAVPLSTVLKEAGEGFEHPDKEAMGHTFDTLARAPIWRV